MNTVFKQQTLAGKVEVAGVGLHSGMEARVVLKPAMADEGITLVRTDVADGVFHLRPEMVKASPLCTLLENGHGVTLSTVEHLLAALHGLGVDNALVEIEGPEVPIVDGSALPWVEAIDRAGRVSLAASRTWLKMGEEAARVEDGDKQSVATHADEAGLTADVTIDFAHALVGRQRWAGFVDEATFRAEIAPARTFVLESQVAAARKAGLIKGGSLDNAVVFGDDGTVLNAEGLRFEDEPVRHKVLDLLGDLYMAGLPVWARVDAVQPGHTVNNVLLRKIAE
ncbi:MAG: UDP-3-O-[3-hydroxymyristoyl] N-acetylglucosamine deacetylase [Pseudomonadaceae bacterium]|nr:UDP-3-O-[3-hydroxymyristoyl] N-acetylglucosamine deacetylase [Pseudomonadaceae bacterium]